MNRVDGSRPYRVLHLHPDLRVGGGQVRVLRTIRTMETEAFVHSVAYFLPQREMETAYRDAGFEPIDLGHRRGVRSIRTCRHLVRLLRHSKIDLVHMHNQRVEPFGRLAAAWCRVPTLGSLVAEPVRPDVRSRPSARRQRFNPRRRASMAIGRWSVRRVESHMMAVSNYVRLVHLDYLRALGIPWERTHVIHPGVPVAEFSRGTSSQRVAELRSELRLESRYPVLINVGRLHPVKGQRWLIPMMKVVREHFPKARLVIVGEGEERSRIERDVNEAGLAGAISLVGARNDVAALLGLSDCHVFTSSREGFGSAVVEGMAAGKPTVSFRFAAVDEILEHGETGYVVEQADPSALARAVIDVVGNRERARSMGQNAQRVARLRFDVAAAGRALERLYGSIIRSARINMEGEELTHHGRTGVSKRRPW